MQNKKQMGIQTRKVFDNETEGGYYFMLNDNEKIKQKIKNEIKEYKAMIKESKDRLVQVPKKISLKKYKSQHTYEDWVKKLRDMYNTSEEYILVENDDSKEVSL